MNFVMDVQCSSICFAEQWYAQVNIFLANDFFSLFSHHHLLLFRWMLVLSIVLPFNSIWLWNANPWGSKFRKFLLSSFKPNPIVTRDFHTKSILHHLPILGCKSNCTWMVWLKITQILPHHNQKINEINADIIWIWQSENSF